jgi:hypothetical protein
VIESVEHVFGHGMLRHENTQRSTKGKEAERVALGHDRDQID